MGLSVTKETNQYFGKYFENAICSVINRTDFINLTGYSNFTNEDIQIMNNDAEIAAKFLNAKSATWVGDKTKNKNCDIIADDQNIEIKYVSAGNGTYFNTSIYTFSKYGFDFKNYMEKYGLYDALKKSFPQIKISKTNNSPVSQTNSSTIRYEYTKLYNDIIVPIDQEVRKYFTMDLINYFQYNIDSLYNFLVDMINKNTETVGKEKPDRFIVYNYQKKEISDINLNEININNLKIKQTDKGFTVGDIRVQIGWQNGNGLNNPTIRIFLK